EVRRRKGDGPIGCRRDEEVAANDLLARRHARRLRPRDAGLDVHGVPARILVVQERQVHALDVDGGLLDARGLGKIIFLSRWKLLRWSGERHGFTLKCAAGLACSVGWV